MILQQGAVTLDALRQLFSGEALALHVSGYYQPPPDDDPAERLLRLLAHPGLRPGQIYESNVQTFSDTVRDDKLQYQYLSRAESVIAAVREAFGSHASPIDRLRCELDELWPGGAQLLRIDTRALVFGMARVWRTGAEAKPHFDNLQETAPQVEQARGVREQLGANVYVRMPEEADEGAVELWDINLADEDVARHGIDGTYGFRRDLLPPPTCVIRPVLGDLVLLRSTKLHAVRPTVSGERITLSGFIGYCDEATPLRMWS